MRFARIPKDDPEINLIPMIDVLLVIIIFLMLTTTYARYAELKINLPSADADRKLERANEIDVVGAAIKKSGIPREDIFLVSKIWMTNYGYEAAKESINESLRKLQTDYLDLMLLHQPFCDYYGAWQALEEAYREGQLRAIGVSNFYPDRLIDLCANVEIRPMVNQVETHVFQQQSVARRYMQELGVAPMAWGPLAEGKNGFFQNETLIKIGEKYGKTGPQVVTASRTVLAGRK